MNTHIFTRFYGYDLPRLPATRKHYRREKWWFGDWLVRWFR